MQPEAWKSILLHTARTPEKQFRFYIFYNTKTEISNAAFYLPWKSLLFFYSLPSYYLFAIMSRYLTVKITYLTYKKIPDDLTLT